jgi:hypothetical protein
VADPRTRRRSSVAVPLWRIAAGTPIEAIENKSPVIICLPTPRQRTLLSRSAASDRRRHLDDVALIRRRRRGHRRYRRSMMRRRRAQAFQEEARRSRLSRQFCLRESALPACASRANWSDSFDDIDAFELDAFEPVARCVRCWSNRLVPSLPDSELNQAADDWPIRHSRRTRGYQKPCAPRGDHSLQSAQALFRNCR